MEVQHRTLVLQNLVYHTHFVPVADGADDTMCPLKHTDNDLTTLQIYDLRFILDQEDGPYRIFSITITIIDSLHSIAVMRCRAMEAWGAFNYV